MILQEVVLIYFKLGLITAMENIPDCELNEVIRFIAEHKEYLDVEYVQQSYRSCNIFPMASPFSSEILSPVKDALQNKHGVSVIRIGDGEANLLSYGTYPTTPYLNSYVVKEIVSMQQDSFKVNEVWGAVLRELMMGAIAQADIIGVLGIWRSQPYPTVESMYQQFSKNVRGISGHWRGIDLMLNLASEGRLQHKLISSAHLYFAVLEQMSDLIELADKIIIISDKIAVVQKLQQKYPASEFDYIAVGIKTGNSCYADSPEFLSDVFSALPLKMNGYLCLIGAGIWAEMYCTWVKQRGGVGIDIGSGFDLLEGIISRSVHRKIGLDKKNNYKL